jgi:nucleoporin SEH1
VQTYSTTMATQTAFLGSSHQDLLTSLAFNTLSPHLLATSSLDARIRIHARPPPQSYPADGQRDDGAPQDRPSWEEVACFKAHEGPVLRVRWAEGEWGDVLASCGSDGSVRIWDQVTVPSPPTAGAGTPAQGGGKRWQQRACLTEARGSVRDLAFAPAEFGLRLASISADGCLRIYDCPDPSEGFSVLPGAAGGAGVTGLATWNLLEQIEPAALPLTACSSATFATGPAASTFSTYAASAISLPGAPGQGSNSSVTGSYPSVTGANTSSSGGSSAGNVARPAGLMEADGGWALSWCKETWYGECLAVASGAQGVVRVRAAWLASIAVMNTSRFVHRSSTWRNRPPGPSPSSCSRPPRLGPRPSPRSTGRPAADDPTSSSPPASAMARCGSGR